MKKYPFGIKFHSVFVIALGIKFRKVYIFFLLSLSEMSIGEQKIYIFTDNYA